MNARNKIASAFAMFATVVGLTVGLAPASAAPPQSGAFLAVADDPANPLSYRMVVVGTFPMRELDAVGFIDNISTSKRQGGIEFVIWGDDSDGVTKIFGRFYPGIPTDPDGYVRATQAGLTYQRYISVPRGDLNEDKDGDDEIYAKVNIFDADGVLREQASQKITRSF